MAAVEYGWGGLKVQYRVPTIKETLEKGRVGGAEPVTRREGC